MTSERTRDGQNSRDIGRTRDRWNIRARDHQQSKSGEVLISEKKTVFAARHNSREPIQLGGRKRRVLKGRVNSLPSGR